ncbi:MAG: hypothetical protein QME46_01130 [Thermoanaerobacteraceae bacterium]|nr:hypothetical protein [Thermoanaerobacteraceae bacterium]
MLSPLYYSLYMQNESLNGARNLPSCCTFCGYMARPSSSGMTCRDCSANYNYKKAGPMTPLKIIL